MTKQTVTRRQKDISRLIREKYQIQKDLIQNTQSPSVTSGRRKKGPLAHRRKTKPILTEADKRQIDQEGLSVREVIDQIGLFQKGLPFIDLNRPCRVGDGIDVIPEADQGRLIGLHEEAAARGRLLKFVPASGAASRMFMDWYRLLEEGDEGQAAEKVKLDAVLDKYAFVDDLGDSLSRAGLDLATLRLEKRYGDILSFILTPAGLNYGQLPKALLKFHQYPSESRTALEEHLVEAALYVRDAGKVSRVHFTVSHNHRNLIWNRLAEIRATYEKRYDLLYKIDVSVQESRTNTIAVDDEDRPFRLEDGRLCFRPGGHGALLENLNAIDGDIIFLKNIDNVVPDRLKAATVFHKKLLCGYLVDLQQAIFHYLCLLEEDRLGEKQMKDAVAFCQEKLHLVFSEHLDALDHEEKRRLIFKILNRPLRVCGMVKNEGEPGGGPFWINDKDAAQSLQIIEAIQVDPRSEAQKSLWQKATHFNPVDLVCGVRDFRGEKFNLLRFVNPQTAFVARKTERGRNLKALEHPGLWNGAMANWNTVFIEVPITTFHPVKTIEDLLRQSHQPG